MSRDLTTHAVGSFASAQKKINGGVRANRTGEGPYGNATSIILTAPGLMSLAKRKSIKCRIKKVRMQSPVIIHFHLPEPTVYCILISHDRFSATEACSSTA